MGINPEEEGTTLVFAQAKKVLERNSKLRYTGFMRVMKTCPKCGTRMRGKKTSCNECGEEFYGVKDAIYCSKACKLRAWRKQKRKGKTNG